MKIVVVINGDRYDSQILDWLQIQTDIRIEFIRTPSLPLALLRGRELVDTAYFSTIDDDDEYLPGSSDLKHAEIKKRNDIDFVVANGYRNLRGTDTILAEDLPSIAADPLASLFRLTWLNSGNALYRSERVPTSYFSDLYPYAEWTWLAYRLAIDKKRIHVISTPCHRINATPGSLSDSYAYRRAYFGLYERMLTLAPSRSVARLIRRRMAAAWHDQSVEELSQGALRRAFMSHLRSLSLPGGFRYLTYTRHLMRGQSRS